LKRLSLSLEISEVQFAMQVSHHIVWIALCSIVLLVSAVVMSRPAFRQNPTSVMIRKPGCRFLGQPQPAQPEAAVDLNYALLSLAAYGDIKKRKADKEPPRIDAKMAKSRAFDPALLQHVSPLGWEHVNLTGDYTWHTNKRVAKGGFRPLRIPRIGFAKP
jgi:hypothetical protein